MAAMNFLREAMGTRMKLNFVELLPSGGGNLAANLPPEDVPLPPPPQPMRLPSPPRAPLAAPTMQEACGEASAAWEADIQADEDGEPVDACGRVCFLARFVLCVLRRQTIV